MRKLMFMVDWEYYIMILILGFMHVTATYTHVPALHVMNALISLL